MGALCLFSFSFLFFLSSLLRIKFAARRANAFQWHASCYFSIGVGGVGGNPEFIFKMQFSARFGVIRATVRQAKAS